MATRFLGFYRAIAVGPLVLAFAQPCLAANLAANPGFETGALDSWVAHGAAGTVQAGPWYNSAMPRDGHYFVGWAANWSPLQNGGLYQPVATVAGEHYAATAWAYGWTRGGTPDDIALRIGIDPTGGTDPVSGGVAWGDWASPRGAWTRVRCPSVEAAGAQLAVFLQVAQARPIEWVIAGFDDVEVTLAPAGEAPTWGPVIREAEGDHAVIGWLTASPADSSVRYGLTEPDLLRFDDWPSWWHRLDLAGLAPEAEYRWEIASQSAGTPVAGWLGDPVRTRHPPLSPDDQQLLFGAQIFCFPEICAELYQDLTAAGMTLARGDGVSWYEVEPIRGQRDWSAVDAFVNTYIRPNGLRWLPVIAGAPHWASQPPQQAIDILTARGQANLATVFPPKEEFLPDWADFVAEVAQRYGDVADHYEVWNEEDDLFWPVPVYDDQDQVVDVVYGTEPERYAALLAAAYTALKSNDPGCEVAVGGLVNIREPEYLESVYASGAASFDAVAVHPYGDPIWLSWTQRIRDCMVRHGDGDKPIWVTEYGYFWPEEVRAERLRRTLRYLREHGYITLAALHPGNYLMDWVGANVVPNDAFYVWEAMIAEHGPRARYQQDFEAESDEWRAQGDDAATLTRGPAPGGRAGSAASAASAGQWVCAWGNVYVRAPGAQVAAWCYLPAEVPGPIRIELWVKTADLTEAWVRYPAVNDAPRGAWFEIACPLESARLGITEKTIMDIGIAAIAGAAPVTLYVDDFTVAAPAWTDNLPMGWNMISLPARPVDDTPAAIFAGIPIDMRLFRYDTSTHGYVMHLAGSPDQFGACATGEGYWLYGDAELVPAYEGMVWDIEQRIPLAAGWSLIGHPLPAPVALNDCQVRRADGQRKSLDDAAAAGWISLPLYYYDTAAGSYARCGSLPWDADSSLRPWRGYWIHSALDGLELLIPPPLS